MTLNPWRRQEPLDQLELVRLLPPPGDPVLSDDRQRFLEEHLMSNVTEDSRRAGSRRSLALRVAVPVALVAALAGTALAVNRTTAHTDAPTPAAGAPQHISTVAYTLDREKQGTVTVTILKAGVAQPDAPHLQRDLERMGVPARVYVADPSCPPEDGVPDNPVIDDAIRNSIRISHRNGAYFATISPAGFPAGTHLELAFGVTAVSSDPDIEIGLREGAGPACVHAFTTDLPPMPTPDTATPDHS